MNFQAEEIKHSKFMKPQRWGTHLSVEQKISVLKNPGLNLALQKSLEKSYGLTKGTSFQILIIILIAL